jgi:nucleoid-associated protein YgaU
MKPRVRAILGGLVFLAVFLIAYHSCGTRAPSPVVQRGEPAEGDAGATAVLTPPDPLQGISDPLLEERSTDDFPLPPGFSMHIVVENETMETIARETYGSVREWVRIAQANPRIDPIKLRPGTRLRLPPVDYQRPGEPDDIDQLPQEPTIHVVRRNETLGHIAQKYYGRASKYTLILAANRDKIANPDSVRAGMKLVIPPDLENPPRPSDHESASGENGS